jgi:CBS domain containing-hemolysin-like protein
LRDGQEAGILAAGQRSLARNLFDVGSRSAISFGVPIERLAIVDSPVDVTEARHTARRRNHPIVLVRRAGKIVGFLRYSELCVREPKLELSSVIRGGTSDRHLGLLLRLYDAASDVAVLADERGDIRYVVTRRQLLQPLIK